MKEKNVKDNNLNIFRLLRIARDKKFKELADDLLVTPSYINAIEKGTRKPSKRLIRDYANALNVDEEIIEKFSKSKYTSFEKFLLKLLQCICSYDDKKNKTGLVFNLLGRKATIPVLYKPQAKCK